MTNRRQSVTPATNLLIQPGAGISPLLKGIEEAAETIHIVIFRFDRGEIEAAIKRAVRRGVFVHALVAHTSAGQGGESTLRKLEMRLLADGVSVARTAADLIRYHDKLMIVDHKLLYLLGFNYTYLDIDRSRSFGIVTDEPKWVQEAEKLFLADTTRQQYSPECDSFVVSPGNSRQQLMAMLESARSQILIYDGKLSDPDVMHVLACKVRAGVEVKVIGSVGKRAIGVQLARPPMRLHAQAIVCDGRKLFLGSQSLRSLDLDARREVGLIISDRGIVNQVKTTFETDWSNAARIKEQDILPAPDDETFWGSDGCPSGAPISREVSAQSVKAIVKEAIKDALLEALHPSQEVPPLKSTVKEAAKEALAEFVS